MDPLQEIIINTSTEIKFSTHIQILDSYNVMAEVSIYDHINDLVSENYIRIGVYPNAKTAFQEIITRCIDYAKSHDSLIVSINNPCNTELLEKSVQEDAASFLGLDVIIEVNSK